MSPQFKTPTVGRTVLFYPGGNDTLAAKEHNNYAEVLPAVVVQVFGEYINLVVTTANREVIHVRRLSVCHRSMAMNGQSFWDWPDIYPVPDSASTNVFPDPNITHSETGDTSLTYKSFSDDNGNNLRA